MSAINAKASRKMKKYAVLTREPRCFLGSLAFSWEQRKLNEVVNVYDGVHQTPDYKESGVMFLSVENISTLKSEKYISEEAFQRDYKVYPQKGDILMTRIGDVGTPNVVETTEKVAFYVSLALLKPTKINSYFLCNSIQSPLFQKGLKDRTLVTAIPQKINKDEIGKVNIILPTSSQEQQLIGEYFANLDRLITLHQRKFEKLTNVKKSMLEKMFPQNGSSYPEIRFKGFTDPWEQREVGDLLIERSQQAPMSDEYPLMAFIANEGVAPKGERYDRSALVTDTVNKLYKKTEKGDFIYSSNNLETGSIGLNKYGKACISPVYSIFEPTGIADSDFLGRRLVRKDFINAMVKWRQGVIYGQWRIHESDFLKIEISVPSVEEQRKIGAYLDQLDNLITLHQRELEKLQNIKKSMLEKMFV